MVGWSWSSYRHKRFDPVRLAALSRRVLTFVGDPEHGLPVAGLVACQRGEIHRFPDISPRARPATPAGMCTGRRCDSTPACSQGWEERGQSSSASRPNASASSASELSGGLALRSTSSRSRSRCRRGSRRPWRVRVPVPPQRGLAEPARADVCLAVRDRLTPLFAGESSHRFAPPRESAERPQMSENGQRLPSDRGGIDAGHGGTATACQRLPPERTYKETKKAGAELESSRSPARVSSDRELAIV